MQIQLRWVDPKTGTEQSSRFNTPVAFGRVLAEMPSSHDGQSVSPIVLDDPQIDPYHALLNEWDGQLQILDRDSQAGTQVNGVTWSSHLLSSGDRLSIGPVEILISLDLASGSIGDALGTDGKCDRQVGFLFKRRCGRTSTIGCRDCDNGRRSEQDTDADYQDDYDLYPGYGNYGRNYWGYHYYSNRDRYYYDPESRRVDFTEADGVSFEDEADRDYEMTLDAS